VHRSFADFGFAAFVTDRKLFFMAKDSLWKSGPLGRLLITLGAFPVHRESADREALRHAEEVLRQGQVLVLFPEGMRQEGGEVGDLLEGAAFLAARTGARIVPIGSAVRTLDAEGLEDPQAIKITVVVGEPIDPPNAAKQAEWPAARCTPPPRPCAPASRRSTTRHGARRGADGAQPGLPFGAGPAVAPARPMACLMEGDG